VARRAAIGPVRRLLAGRRRPRRRAVDTGPEAPAAESTAAPRPRCARKRWAPRTRRHGSPGRCGGGTTAARRSLSQRAVPDLARPATSPVSSRNARTSTIAHHMALHLSERPGTFRLRNAPGRAPTIPRARQRDKGSVRPRAGDLCQRRGGPCDPVRGLPQQGRGDPVRSPGPGTGAQHRRRGARTRPLPVWPPRPGTRRRTGSRAPTGAADQDGCRRSTNRASWFTIGRPRTSSTASDTALCSQ